MKCKTCSNSEDCSASLYLHNGSYYILGQYGSFYDMQRYALKLDKYQVGDICDECIKKYIESGHAHLIEDGVW
jgi:hypothetical protein